MSYVCATSAKTRYSTVLGPNMSLYCKLRMCYIVLLFGDVIRTRRQVEGTNELIPLKFTTNDRGPFSGGPKAKPNQLR